MKLPPNASPIGRKLVLSFGTAVAITLLITFTGFVNNEILSSTVDRVVVSTSARQALAGETGLTFGDLLSLERGMNLRAMMQDQITVDAYNRDYIADSDRLVVLTKTLFPMLISDADKQQCSLLVELTLKLRRFHEKAYLEITNGGIRDASSPAYVTYRDQFLPLANAGKLQAAHLLQSQRNLIQQEANGAHRTEVRSRYLTSSMLVLFFVMGGVLMSIVGNSARGLREITAGLGQGARQIAAAALDVSSSSQSVARGVTEQALFIEQTSILAKEIAAMAHRNANHAQNTTGMVAHSEGYIVEGNRALNEMVIAMDGIALSSKEISKIVKLIDQIAFQTNILALNAEVEAARAGNAGLSFGVVAGEVRDLSQRSAQAAKDTAQLIDGCIAKSQIGKMKVDEVAQAILSITTESAKVKVLVDKIYTGSQEQSQGIDQVRQGVLQMERVTHRTAAGAEKSALAAGQLNLQSQTLKDIAHNLAKMLGSVLPDEYSPEVRVATLELASPPV